MNACVACMWYLDEWLRGISSMIHGGCDAYRCSFLTALPLLFPSCLAVALSFLPCRCSFLPALLSFIEGVTPAFVVTLLPTFPPSLPPSCLAVAHMPAFLPTFLLICLP
jgi:hypothetical protein